MPRPHKSALPELTPEHRRRQIVMILSAGLVAMSPAVAVPPDLSPDMPDSSLDAPGSPPASSPVFPPDPGLENSLDFSPKSAESP